MAFGIGIGLGAGVQSALQVYGAVKQAQSQEINDRLKEQQLESGKLDLQLKADQASASRDLDALAKQYFGGETRSDPSGDYGPGEAPNIKTKLNVDAMNDPETVNKFMAAALPSAMKMLGPEKGMAFMREYQESVKGMVPQAAQKFAVGDYVGGAAMLRASGGRFKDLTAVEPHMESSGGPESEMRPSGFVTLKFGENGSKGHLNVDPQAFLEYSLNPGKLLELSIQRKNAQSQAVTAGAAAKRADTDAKELDQVKVPELGIKRDKLALEQTAETNKMAIKEEELRHDNTRLGIEQQRADTGRDQVTEARRHREAVEATNDLFKRADDARKAESAASVLFDKLGKEDPISGKTMPSPLKAALPGLMADAEKETPKGGSVGATLQPKLDQLIKNAEVVGGQLAASAKKDDKGKALAADVAHALEQGVTSQEIRMFGAHMGVPNEKLSAALATAREAKKKPAEGAKPAAGVGLGAAPREASGPAVQSTKVVTEKIRGRDVKFEVGYGIQNGRPVEVYKKPIG